MNTWDADIDLPFHKIEEIIRARFPQHLNFQPFGHGWDNTVVLADGEVIFRLPHRKLASELILHEINILPILAQSLPIPTPRISHVGYPGQDYPYHFIAYPLLSGQSADSTTWSPSERLALIPELSKFLQTLHQIQSAPAPTDLLHRKDPNSTLKKIEARLAQISLESFPLDKITFIRHCQRLASACTPSPKTCLLHGDLYPRHLLVNSNKQISAVIDWGDAHMGNPGVDLSLAFTFVPPEGRNEFFDLYGDVDPNDRMLAELRACMYGCALLHYGLSQDDQNASKMGSSILRELPL